MRAQDGFNNFSAGVIDPRLSERADLQEYNSGLRRAHNVLVQSYGGVTRRPGRRDLSPLRNKLLWWTKTVPPGGEGTKNTSAVNTNDDFQVVAYGLNEVANVACVDFVRFRAENQDRDDAVVCQYLDGETWRDFGTPVNLRRGERTRRFALPPGQVQAAQDWRIVVRGASGVGRIYYDDIRIFTDTGEASAYKEVRMRASDARSYMVVLTDITADIYRDDVWVGSVPTYIRSSQVPSICAISRLDTLLLFAPNSYSWFVQWQGAPHEWEGQRISYSNVPTLDDATQFGVAQDAVQTVRLTGITDGQAFQLVHYATPTAEILFTPGDTAGMETNIETALEKLSSISDGVAVSVSADAFSLTAQITFGGGNGDRRVPPLELVLPAGVSGSVEETQAGRAVAGPLIGPDAGHPTCAAFYQDRLWLGGFPMRPQTIVGSVVGNYFDLDTGVSGANGAIEMTLGTDQMEQVRHLVGGAHLQVFTDAGEWYVPNRVIDRNQPVVVVRASSYGAAVTVSPVVVEDGTLFVQEGGTVLRRFAYDERQQNYVAGVMSLLGAHLLTGVMSLAYQPERGQDQPPLIHVVNADGTAAAMAYQPSLGIAAWVSGDAPDGRLRHVAVDGDGVAHWIVERDGAARRERDDADLLLDAATSFAFPGAPLGPSPTDTLTGLDHHEGRTLRVYADRSYAGEYTVTGGQIVLPSPVSTAEVGLHVPVEIEPQPRRRRTRSGRVLRGPRRVASVDLMVEDSGDFEMAANGGPVRSAIVRRFPNGILDTPMLDDLYTGEVRVDKLPVPLTGQARTEASVVLTQAIAAPLKLRAIYMEGG